MSLAPVFDFATAVATIAVPLVTIWGWRYVSRNERRLALLVDARDEMMKALGQYMDYASDARELLLDDEIPVIPSDHPVLSERMWTRQWINLLKLRDYDAVFPQARPIREAILGAHRAFHSDMPAAAAGACEDRVAVAQQLAEVVDAILVLRVAISNVVTRDLFIRTDYQVVDVGKFGIAAVPVSSFEGQSAFKRAADVVLPRSLRKMVWLLTGEHDYAFLWEYEQPASDKPPHGVAAGGVGSQVEVGRPIPGPKRSALYALRGWTG